MRKPLSAPTRKSITLSPVRPNLGVEITYQHRLDALIDRMGRAVLRTIAAQWRRKPPKMAVDESSPAALQAVIDRMVSEWEGRFEEFGKTWARGFTAASVGSADRAMAAALKRAGFTVKFTISAKVREIVTASVASNVQLIKSIPAEYLTQVQGHVQRSVMAGRDLGTLSKALVEQFGVTKKRAALISRHQNNMATASVQRARQEELGITEAIWLHSAGGRQPRPTHVTQSGKPYKISEGWLDPATDKHIWPGTEINCGCVSKSIIPGL